MRLHPHPNPAPGRLNGFTLVETIIVVLIIGILAALVVPRFTDAAGESRVTNTMVQLRTLRTALKRYQLEHGQYPAPGRFWDKLTHRTTHEGDFGADARFGPYIAGPSVNVYTNSSVITTDPDAARADAGWVYDPDSPWIIRAVAFDEDTQTFSTTPRSTASSSHLAQLAR